MSTIIRKIYKIIDKIFGKTILKPFLQRLRQIFYIILYKHYVKKEKVNNLVLFLSDSRDDISGNFEFIYKELEKYDFELKSYLRINKGEKNYRKNLSRDMARARYILVDDFYPMIYAINLRKETELIQVWHAMGAFKTVGFSRLGKKGGPSKYSLTHKNYDATIVSSENIRKNYAVSFGIDIKKVHALGIPRTDIFFDKDYIKNKKAEIYLKYPILKNKKVITFAPTFRGDGKNSAYYDFNLIDFNKLKEKFSKEYVFILKLHPFIKNIEDLPKDDDFFLNLTQEREINDLLFVTDILITDYSSVIFEYSLLNKKLIFYVPDLKEYIESRDFYYDFDKYTYGDVARTEEELIKCIENPNIDTKKLNEFKEYFCGACDGNSTKRFVEKLILKEDKK